MILSNLLHIYQLEFYDTRRFLRFVYTHLNWWRLSHRGTIDWTLRARLLAVLTILAFIVLLVVAFLSVSLGGFLVSVLALYFALPLLIVLADVIIAPAVLFQKRRITMQAKEVLTSNSLTRIGITGSFGKTTMKHMLAAMLEEHLKVHMIPGNINVDIGVAQYVLKHREAIKQADVLIVEMGAFRRGDIKTLCDLVAPTYSITTAIGLNHLDRFGSREAIAQTKLELSENTLIKSFFNGCDGGLCDALETYPGHVSESDCVCKLSDISDHTFVTDFGGQSFVFEGDTYTTKLIAPFIPELAMLGIKVAKELGVPVAMIQEGFKALPQVEHRLQVIHNPEAKRTVIDDSYNGNYAGFLAGLKILDRATGRTLVLTPGIVELGDMTEEIHTDLAKAYVKQVDCVLLINTPATRVIQKVFAKQQFKNYIMYASAHEAHEALPAILESGDTILFQNDVTDNYV